MKIKDVIISLVLFILIVNYDNSFKKEILEIA